MAWIRSQNRKELINVDGFRIQESYQIPEYVLFALLPCTVDYVVIGQFATKEAALAEMDRLEVWLERQDGKGVFQVSEE